MHRASTHRNRIPRPAVTRTGEIYHMNGLTRQARNFTLGLLPPRMLLARNDWLYGFRTPE